MFGGVIALRLLQLVSRSQLGSVSLGAPRIGEDHASQSRASHALTQRIPQLRNRAERWALSGRLFDLGCLSAIAPVEMPVLAADGVLILSRRHELQ